MVLDFQRALDHLENSLDDLRSKYMNVRIIKNFFKDDNTGEVRGYSGRVTSSDWSREDGSYMFHVVYDSDSDEEDMELWDVEQYKVSI